jgi:hypothetical protein
VYLGGVTGSSSSLSNGSSSTSGSCDLLGLVACSDCVGDDGLSAHGGGISSRDEVEPDNAEWLVGEKVEVMGDGEARSDEDELWV